MDIEHHSPAAYHDVMSFESYSGRYKNIKYFPQSVTPVFINSKKNTGKGLNLFLQYKLKESVKNSAGNIFSFSKIQQYNEETKIPGNNMFEIISHISQNDKLNETNNDGFRCGAASLVNAFLLMGGNFEKITSKFSLENKITYKNIHLLQEKIYNFANRDKNIGLVSSYRYYYDNTGKIYSSESNGEMYDAAGLLDLKIKPIIGSSVSSIYQRKTAVELFFKNNPQGVLQVSVCLNMETGDISGASKETPNHFIIIFKRDDGFYIADTSQRNNGDGNHITKLTETRINDLVFNTVGIISGLTLKESLSL